MIFAHMSDPKLLDASQVDPSELDVFLRRVYSPRKSDFLKAHGQWLHRSNANRLIVQVEGQITGYCAVIPTQVWAMGKVHSALWWVDLVIAPEFRGMGLQTLFDQRVREMADLLLGFPNELAGAIHRKHGWGVREDAQVLLLPLDPPHVKSVRNAEGSRGQIVRAGAEVLRPLAAIWRGWLASRKTPLAWRLDAFDGGVFANVFDHASSDKLNTTWRDEAYFDWRYGQAPHPHEFRFYLAGTATPTHYLIARHLTQPDGLRYTRILDLFGDFTDPAAIHDLLTLAVQDAIANSSNQVTLVASGPQLMKSARRLGFLFSAPCGFCWWSESAELMSAFSGENCWTLSDSDNDEPE
jgi:hypothetical protein